MYDIYEEFESSMQDRIEDLVRIASHFEKNMDKTEDEYMEVLEYGMTFLLDLERHCKSNRVSVRKMIRYCVEKPRRSLIRVLLLSPLYCPSESLFIDMVTEEMETIVKALMMSYGWCSRIEYLKKAIALVYNRKQIIARFHDTFELSPAQFVVF